MQARADEYMFMTKKTAGRRGSGTFRQPSQLIGVRV
jgi:hypothetical protein